MAQSTHKSATKTDVDFEIKPGTSFTKGTLMFTVLGEIEGKPGSWDVRCTSASAGFRKIKPKFIPMSEAEISALYIECMLDRRENTLPPPKNVEKETIQRKLPDGLGIQKLQMMYAMKQKMRNSPSAFAA